ncbi:MAG: methyltransferase domain-containing protein [Betaproteobacteria bacterium]|nr:methyltransferase domain-containing protein [Betaproteobacteria bacterium]MDH4322677.1 methyltransferase domain-containing protein [Betaproteobacteria bacterium]
MNRKQRRTLKKKKVVKTHKLLKLDFGCGKTPREGFEGVDARDFGQKHIVDLTKPWPWKNGSVEEAHCSHFIEHLTGEQRIHFVNELYRVLIPDGKCLVIVPHWASGRAYGDLTHQWPPVSEFWFYYLSKPWRAANAPHNDKYECDFAVGWGYNLHPEIQQRNPEYQQEALKFNKEAAQDTIATFTKIEAKKGK